MRILAISGSLRAASANTGLIEALPLVAPPEVEVVVYRGIGQLPHFNPDLDGDAPPAVVAELRQQIGRCDGLVICSPEYAHGVAGTMKNALDWLVASLEFAGTPVALINASPLSEFAQPQMRETLTVMSGDVVDAASLTIPLQGGKKTAAQIAADPEMSARLRAALAGLVDHARKAATSSRA
jgi:chromate reductase, NAD(P)H dehydrogenase (quinone)